MSGVRTIVAWIRRRASSISDNEIGRTGLSEGGMGHGFRSTTALLLNHSRLEREFWPKPPTLPCDHRRKAPKSRLAVKLALSILHGGFLKRVRRSMPTIKPAERGDKDKVYATLTLAFIDDPVMRWIMPEGSEYLRSLPTVQGSLGARAFEHDGAICFDDYSGAALWLPPGIEVDGDTMAAVVEERAPEKLRPDLYKMMEQMGALHPSEPHWYLAVLGVDAHHQGKGLGSLLMKHALVRVDKEHAIAYLESSNPRNIPFYERHGFDVVGEIQTGDSPVVTGMLRRPR
jgi:ribosomal protein S18 acetylase RimI-like enzyme